MCVLGTLTWRKKLDFKAPYVIILTKPSSGVCAPESFQFALTFSRFAESSTALKVNTLITSVLPPRRFEAFNLFCRPLCWSWHSIFLLTTFPRFNSWKVKSSFCLSLSCFCGVVPRGALATLIFYKLTTADVTNVTLISPARELAPWTKEQRQVGSQDMTLKLDLLASWLTRIDCRWFLPSPTRQFTALSCPNLRMEAESEEKNLPAINISPLLGFVKLAKFCQVFLNRKVLIKRSRRLLPRLRKQLPRHRNASTVYDYPQPPSKSAENVDGTNGERWTSLP